MKRQLKYKCCNVKTSLFGKHLTSGCRPWVENAAGLSSLMAHVRKSKRTFGVFEQTKDDFLLMQMIARYQNAETMSCSQEGCHMDLISGSQKFLENFNQVPHCNRCLSVLISFYNFQAIQTKKAAL